MCMNLSLHTTRISYLFQILSAHHTSVEVLWRVSQQWAEARLHILTITSRKFDFYFKLGVIPRSLLRQFEIRNFRQFLYSFLNKSLNLFHPYFRISLS